MSGGTLMLSKAIMRELEEVGRELARLRDLAALVKPADFPDYSLVAENDRLRGLLQETRDALQELYDAARAVINAEPPDQDRLLGKLEEIVG